MSEVGKELKRLLRVEKPEQVRRAHKREYDRLVLEGERSASFGELLERFPEDDLEARGFLTGAHIKAQSLPPSVAMNLNTGAYEVQHMRPILDREELEKLKKENPQLYARITSTYIDFLEEQSGLQDKK